MNTTRKLLLRAKTQTTSCQYIWFATCGTGHSSIVLIVANSNYKRQLALSEDQLIQWVKSSDFL